MIDCSIDHFNNLQIGILFHYEIEWKSIYDFTYKVINNDF